MKNNLNIGFKKAFDTSPTHYFSCGGRFEILGNHTDHNHGLCLAATCNLAINSAVKKRDDLIVDVVSKGYDSFKVDLSNLNINKEEYNSSIGLIRGIAFYLKNLGNNFGGFSIYMESDIFKGAGVSSSAAFELLIGQIFNELYNNNQIDRLTLAKAGQYSENNYFNKKSGLLDQIGVAYGNVSFIDFKDIDNPIVENINIDFPNLHYVIVNTGGSHAELSSLYSEIPFDMQKVASSAGVSYLRDTSLDKIDLEKCNQRQYLRAKHFYSECLRVDLAKSAIQNKDLKAFLNLINESRISSTNDLKNMQVEGVYEGSPLEACDIGMAILKDKGAMKINGGGFAGSVICFLLDEILDLFIIKMSNKYGKENVQEVFIRPDGPKLVNN